MFVCCQSFQVFLDLSEKEMKHIRALFREVQYVSITLMYYLFPANDTL